MLHIGRKDRLATNCSVTAQKLAQLGSATITPGRRKASMGWILFLLFVAMPIAEIAVLIQVGGIIGTWPTIGIVIFTAFTGAFLAKMEGRAAMQRLAQAVQSGQAPIVPVLDAAAVFTGGLLLLTPGFITDILGLSLLFGPTRLLWGKAIAGMSRRHRSKHGQRAPADGVIDGVFVEVDPNYPGNGPNGSQPPIDLPPTDLPPGRPGPSSRYERGE